MLTSVEEVLTALRDLDSYEHRNTAEGTYYLKLKKPTLIKITRFLEAMRLVAPLAAAHGDLRLSVAVKAIDAWCSAQHPNIEEKDEWKEQIYGLDATICSLAVCRHNKESRFVRGREVTFCSQFHDLSDEESAESVQTTMREALDFAKGVRCIATNEWLRHLSSRWGFSSTVNVSASRQVWETYMEALGMQRSLPGEDMATLLRIHEWFERDLGSLCDILCD